MFTSSDGSLTKAHVKYLESRLIEIGVDRGRSVLENGKGSTAAWLPEADVSDMEQFVQHVEVLLPVLGIQFTRPKAEDLAAQATGESPTFTYTTKGATARGREADGEFVVLRGSTASAKPAASLDTYVELRDRLIEEAALMPHESDEALLVFTRDVVFSSVSAAATVVGANTISGRSTWKIEGTGQTYGEWQDARIEASEAGKAT